ncbi:MAG: S9 family peptidase, partial [Phenylobacterium zucineum]
MRTVHLVSVLALLAAAPALAAPPSEPAASTQASARPTYSAAQFFENRSYQLNGGSRVGAFSTDGRSILISSDQTGVFNAYALPIAGGDPVPLTNS